MYEVYADNLTELRKLVTFDFIMKNLIGELRGVQEIRYNGWKGLNIAHHSIVFNESLVTLYGGDFSTSRATANNTCFMSVPWEFEELKSYDYKQSEFYSKVITRMFAGRRAEERYFAMHMLHEYFDGGGMEVQQMPVLAGIGGSGKSVLTNAILRMGRLCDSVSSVQDFSQLIGADARFNKAPLCTSRLMFVSDTTMGRNNNWDAMKEIINKGNIPIEVKFQQPEERKVTAALVANTNDPTVREAFQNDSGLRRRFFLLEFNNAVPSSEKDRKLPGRLDGLEEQRAVWAWMLQNYLESCELSEDPFDAIPNALRITKPTVEDSDLVAAKVLRVKGYRGEASEDFPVREEKSVATIVNWVAGLQAVEGNVPGSENYIPMSEINSFKRGRAMYDLNALDLTIIRDAKNNPKVVLYKAA